MSGPGDGPIDELGVYLLGGRVKDPARLEYYTVLNMYWATIACSGTAPRIADDGMTHLDVMMPFVSGLGAFFIGELTKVLTEKG